MNILYLANHLNTGGITSYLLTLASSLKQKGHNLYIASSPGDKLDSFIQSGANLIRLPLRTKSEISLKVGVSFFILLSRLKREKIDIIHANTRVTQVLACLLSRFSKVPYISTCHGFFKARRLSRRLFPCWGSKVIAISEQVKEHLVVDFKVPEPMIALINNGIDVEKYSNQRPVARNQEKSPVISIVARLSDVKGHRYLFEAMVPVLAKFPCAKLFVVGEGREKDNLVKLADELGISRSIMFTPRVSDTRDILSVTDIFVMPSLKEGLGLALMEAMASAKAVIGSDVGGIKALIRHNHTGLLVKPADSQAIASAILELLSDPGKGKALGDRARIFIRDNFSQGRMADETERVYKACLNAKS